MIIFDALNDRSSKDIYMEIDGELQKLNKAEAPHPIYNTFGKAGGKLTVETDFDKPSLEIGVYNVEVQGWLTEPKQMPGVLYLVELEILLLATHRDDYVAPGTYALTTQSTKNLTSDEDVDMLFTLASVMKRP